MACAPQRRDERGKSDHLIVRKTSRFVVHDCVLPRMAGAGVKGKELPEELSGKPPCDRG
jgi:hypothetical protein